MNDNNNSVIFLKDWKILIQSLSKENQLEFWDLFMEYATDPNIQCENETIQPIWNFVKSQLDNMRSKYNAKKESIRNRNRENGKLGGRPKAEPKIEIQETEEQIELPLPEDNNITDPLLNSEIYSNCCDFFSQKTEYQKMQLFGDLKRLERENKLTEFTSQTIAYIQYKSISNEKVHGWQSYLSEYKKTDWIDKLSKWKEKPKQKTNGEYESDPNDPKVGKNKLSDYSELYEQMVR